MCYVYYGRRRRRGAVMGVQIEPLQTKSVCSGLPGRAELIEAGAQVAGRRARRAMDGKGQRKWHWQCGWPSHSRVAHTPIETASGRDTWTKERDCRRRTTGLSAQGLRRRRRVRAPREYPLSWSRWCEGCGWISSPISDCMLASERPRDLYDTAVVSAKLRWVHYPSLSGARPQIQRDYCTHVF